MSFPLTHKRLYYTLGSQTKRKRQLGKSVGLWWPRRVRLQGARRARHGEAKHVVKVSEEETETFCPSSGIAR
jgi:hypothetical protein